MQRTVIKTFHHTTFNYSYKITVSIPSVEIPQAGFPILYVLDGNAYGTMLTEILKLQWRRSEKTYVLPMIVVHIDYNTDEVFHPLRVYDFTPLSDRISLPERPNGKRWPEHGGAKKFLQFLEQVVQPFVYEQAPVNSQQQILFGHSLGGLFTLYTLFKHPDLFQYYISCSPSIWWNECELLTYERTSEYLNGRRLFIAAEREGKLKMYDHALALSKSLKEKFPSSVASTFPPGENHMSIVPTVISEAMRFFYSHDE